MGTPPDDSDGQGGAAPPLVARPKPIDIVLDSVKSTPGWGLSLVVLFAGAVKLFSVSQENAATAVAIIRTTSTATLLAGTFASLLPAFVAILIAMGVWWWTETVCPTPEDPLIFENSGAIFALILLGVVAFFTMPVLEWIFFAVGGALLFGFLGKKLLFQVPKGRRNRNWHGWIVVGSVVAAYGVLAFIVLGRQIPRAGASFLVKVIMYVIVIGIPLAAMLGWFVAKPRRIRGKCRFDFQYAEVRLVRDLALAVAGAVTVTVLLTGTMWLPVERVNIGSGVDLEKFSHVAFETDSDGTKVIAAYVLKLDSSGITLLTDRERAVVQLAAGNVASHQVCAPAPTSVKWLLLYERPSQILTNPTLQLPYKYCPQPLAASAAAPPRPGQGKGGSNLVGRG